MFTISILSVILGAVVRLLKSDTKIPIDVPPKYRAALAGGLGLVAGAVDLVAGGSSWHAAAATLFCPLLAMAGHEVFIEAGRGGKELPLPAFMMKP